MPGGIPSRGYALPDTITGHDTVCIPVTIPAHPYYIGAFWTSLNFLGTWVAWEKDGTTRAREAAAYWKAFLEQARAAYDSGQGCGGQAIMLRQSDVNPCHLEQSLDGGDSWSLAFDYSLCQPGYVLPLESVEASRDDLLWAIREMLQVLVDALDSGATASQASAILASEFKTATGRDLVKSQADALAAAWYTLTPAERAALVDASGPLEDTRDELACSGQSTTTMWQRLREIGLATVDALRTAFTTYGDMMADLWRDGLFGQPDVGFIHNLITWGRARGGGAASFGWDALDCPPVGTITHSWDFRGSTRGWTADAGGTWLPGLGWELGPTGGEGAYIPLPREGTPTAYACVATYYRSTSSGTQAGSLHLFNRVAGTEPNSTVILNPLNVNGTYETAGEIIPYLADGLALRKRWINIAYPNYGRFIVHNLSVTVAYGDL